LHRYFLIEARKKLGYSQRKTARIAGISFQHYSKIEKGDRGRKVSFIIFSDIAKVLDISLDDLYYFEREYRDKIDFDEEFNKY
jgi:transcriptional regulator with XRE-family HTH domain